MPHCLGNALFSHIKHKLIFAILSAFSFIYIPTLTYVFLQNKKDLYQSMENEALSVAKILSISIYRNYELSSDLREIQSFLIGSKRSKEDLVKLRVINKDFQILASTNHYELKSTVVGEDYLRAENNLYSLELVGSKGDDIPYIRIVYPISQNLEKGKVPSGILELHFSTLLYQRQLSQVSRNIVFAGFVIFVVIGFVTYIVSITISRPINDLYLAMEKANSGDLSVRVNVSSKDEIAYATTTFNQMLASIETSNKSLERKSQELVKLNENLKKMASRLKEAERLEIIGTLTSVIAHQIKNPLSIIIGAVSAMKRRGEGSEFQDILEQESHRTLDILERFLDFAKKQNIVRVKLDFSKFLNNIIENYKNEFEDIEIINNILPNIWVQIDQRLFIEVVINILNNARDAMRTSSSKQITISLLKKEEVELLISDTGQGVEEVSNVFEPFYTTKASGVGLGLSMAKKIVILHEGSLEIENNKDSSGVTVIIRLPGG